MIWKGSAIGGAFFVSGCSVNISPGTILGLAANPLQIVSSALFAMIALLGMWWVILRLSSRRPPKRLFAVTVALFLASAFLASIPLLALNVAIVWPSLSIMAQVSAFASGAAALILFGSFVILVWVLLAALIDRL